MRLIGNLSRAALVTSLLILPLNAYAVKVPPPLNKTSIAGAHIGQNDGLFVRLVLDEYGHGLLVTEYPVIEPLVYEVVNTRIFGHRVSFSLVAASSNADPATFVGEVAHGTFHMVWNSNGDSVDIALSDETVFCRMLRNAKVAADVFNARSNGTEVIKPTE